MMMRVESPAQPLNLGSERQRIGSATPAAAAGEFGTLLAEALNRVEKAQVEASDAAGKLATGEIRDVAEVMIASEKAALALQLTVQVRNKVIEAYQEIMRMPV